jgi:hypothetical protein
MSVRALRPYLSRPCVILRLDLKLAALRIAVAGLGGRAPTLAEPLFLSPCSHGSSRQRSACRRARANRHAGRARRTRKWAGPAGRTNCVGGLRDVKNEVPPCPRLEWFGPYWPASSGCCLLDARAEHTSLGPSCPRHARCGGGHSCWKSQIASIRD